MPRNVRRSRLGEVFSLMGDTIAVVAAVRMNHQPEAQALRRLGIDPEQFGRIGRS